MNRCGIYAMLLAAGMLVGCGEKKDDTSGKEGVETVLPSQVNEVTVMTLKKTAFSHELVSNGPHSMPTFRSGLHGQKIAELDLLP